MVVNINTFDLNSITFKTSGLSLFLNIYMTMLDKSIANIDNDIFFNDDPKKTYEIVGVFNQAMETMNVAAPGLFDTARELIHCIDYNMLLNTVLLLRKAHLKGEYIKDDTIQLVNLKMID